MAWAVIDGFLIREFLFDNFVEAITFIDKIVPIAEEANHHPDILLHSYSKVKIMLKTHSVDKVTDKDYLLAKKIDGLL